MKAIVFLTIAFFAQVALASQHPWQDISGCYMTVERNGAPVINDPDMTYGYPISFTDKAADGNITDIRGKTLPAMEFILFLKYDESDNSNYSTYHPVFANVGQFSQHGNTRIYSVNDKFILNYDGRHNFTMIARTEIEKLENGALRVKILRTVPEVPSGEFDLDEELVLKPFGLKMIDGVCDGSYDTTPPNFGPVSR